MNHIPIGMKPADSITFMDLTSDRIKAFLTSSFRTTFRKIGMIYINSSFTTEWTTYSKN